MAASGLDWISTRWPLIHDPGQFVLRYAPAIRKYLGVLVRDPNDADEIAQEFLLAVAQHCFAKASPDRGRFRDYLKKSVRNALASHFRKRRPSTFADDDALQQIADETSLRAEDVWLAEWKQCIVNRALRDLDQHQRQSPGNLCHTGLRRDFPDDTSEQLAERASAELGKPLRADALRKQLSRARKLFAAFLIAEVKKTLVDPDDDTLREELAELGLQGIDGEEK